MTHEDFHVRVTAAGILKEAARVEKYQDKLAKLLSRKVKDIFTENLAEEQYQVAISLLLSTFPNLAVLKRLGLDQLGITVDNLESTNRIFDSLQLSEVSIGTQQLLKSWILGALQSGEDRDGLMHAVHTNILPLVRILDYLNKDLPSLTVMTYETTFEKARGVAEIILLNYTAMIQTPHMVRRSGYRSGGGSDQLVRETLPV